MPDYLNKLLKLNELVDYSKDAVVSKIIYKNEHTILTLFALTKESSIAEHVTPFDAMVQILEGEAEITIDQQKRRVAAGEVVIMPANKPHALYATTNYKMLLTMMK